MDVQDLAKQAIADQHARIERLERIIRRAIPVLDMLAVTDDDPEYKSILAAAKAALSEKR